MIIADLPDSDIAQAMLVEILCTRTIFNKQHSHTNFGDQICKLFPTSSD